MTYGQVRLSRDVRAALLAHVRAEQTNETGGILVGYRHQKTLVLTAVSPPGPRAIRRPRRFSRDTQFLQTWLERRCADAVDGSDYVGEWHVHPALDAPPSPVDRRSLKRIARSDQYATRHPLLIIVERSGNERRVRAYVFGSSCRGCERELPVEVGE